MFKPSRVKKTGAPPPPPLPIAVSVSVSAADARKKRVAQQKHRNDVQLVQKSKQYLAIAHAKKARAAMTVDGDNDEYSDSDGHGKELFDGSRTRSCAWDIPHAPNHTVQASRIEGETIIARLFEEEQNAKRQKDEASRIAIDKLEKTPCIHHHSTPEPCDTTISCDHTIDTGDSFLCEFTGIVLRISNLVLGGGHIGYSGPFEEQANAAASGVSNQPKAASMAAIAAVGGTRTNSYEKVVVQATRVVSSLMKGSNPTAKKKERAKKSATEAANESLKAAEETTRTKVKAPVHSHPVRTTAFARGKNAAKAPDPTPPPSIDELCSLVEAGEPLPCAACAALICDAENTWDITQCLRFQCTWIATSRGTTTRQEPNMVNIITTIYNFTMRASSDTVDLKQTMINYILAGGIYIIAHTGVRTIVHSSSQNSGTGLQMPALQRALKLADGDEVVILPCVVFKKKLPDLAAVLDVDSTGWVRLAGKNTYSGSGGGGLTSHPSAPSRQIGSYARVATKGVRGIGESALPIITTGSRIIGRMMYNALSNAENLEAETAGAGRKFMHDLTKALREAIELARLEGSIVVTAEMTKWVDDEDDIAVPPEAERLQIVPLVRKDRPRAMWDSAK